MEGETGVAVGVDECPRGWIAAAIRDGRVECETYTEFAEVAAAYDDASRVLVDIPIGVPERKRRECDVMARELLGVAAALLGGDVLQTGDDLFRRLGVPVVPEPPAELRRWPLALDTLRQVCIVGEFLEASPDGLPGDVVATRTRSLGACKRLIPADLNYGEHGRQSQIGMNVTLGEFYAKLFDRYADSIAVRSAQTRLRYSELGQEAGAFANALREMQLGVGDRVGLLMRNRYEYLVTEVATAQAGGILVPLIDSLDEESIGYIINDADVDILVVGPSYFDIAKEILADSEADLNFIVGVADGGSLPIGFQAYERVISKADDEPPDVEISPSDGVVAQYTSGTTGTQKGALHTHEGLISNIYSHISELDFHRDERMLLTTPLGHSAGYCARGVLAQGGTVLLQDGFKAERVLETIEEEQVTATFAVPTMIAELLESPNLAENKTNSLQTLIYGAAPIPTTTLKKGLDQLGEVFIQLYGLAEVPNLVTVLPKHEHNPSNEAGLNSAGYPVQLANIEVLSDEYEWEDDVGEIAVSSPYAMTGYLNDDGSGDESDPIRTGDLGRIDDAGRLVILDRVNDVILRDGQPIYSTEVENVIHRHPAVSQVAVIGVPRNKDVARRGTTKPRRETDQLLKAVIVPASGNQVDRDDLLEFCRDNLAEYEVPDSVDEVAKLPETPYGKIDKKTLRKPYW